MSTTSRAVRLFGTEAEDAKGRVLRAGSLSAVLEAGGLRYIRIGPTEVIRGITFLVRDENWGTFTPEIAQLEVTERPDGFQVTYRGLCADAQRSLRYAAVITGHASGKLSFVVTANPETDILTNRTGFVVLHPIEGVAGAPLEIEHTDGRKVRDRFPELIKPSQPFFDIRALTHEPKPGLRVTCRMEGDAFEMEDQRNWTDASYKTYVRPLSKPWPYTLPAGKSFEQSVTVTCQGSLPAPSLASGAAEVAVNVGGDTGERMPRIGLGLPAGEVDSAIGVAELIRSTAADLLICRFDCRRADLMATASALRKLMSATGAGCMLEILLPDQGDPAISLAEVKRIADANNLRPEAITVSPAAHLKSYQPDGKWPVVPSFQAMYGAARAAFPGVPLGGGTYAYFTELNRCRPPAELLDFVTHTTLPIVHAADDVSVMETLEALPHVIHSTRAFMGGKGYRIGPTAIPARDNPYGAATAANPGNGRVALADMDPRQRGLFGAAWTLGYLAALAKGGIDVASVGAPTGPSGMITRKADFPQPFFDANRGSPLYPLYHVVAGLAVAAGRSVLDTRSSDRRAVAAIACKSNDSTDVWLANLTDSPQKVVLAAGEANSLRAAILDEDSFATAAGDRAFLKRMTLDIGAGQPLTLAAYAVAHLEERR